MWSKSILKSVMQKAIRRGQPGRALGAASLLWDESPTDLARRLPAVICEDAIPCMSFVESVDAMKQVSQKGATAEVYDKAKAVLMRAVKVAALMPKDMTVVRDVALVWQGKIDVSTWGERVQEALLGEEDDGARIARAMLTRARFGGMKSDVAMLAFLASRYEELRRTDPGFIAWLMDLEKRCDAYHGPKMQEGMSQPESHDLDMHNIGKGLLTKLQSERIDKVKALYGEIDDKKAAMLIDELWWWKLSARIEKPLLTNVEKRSLVFPDQVDWDAEARELTAFTVGLDDRDGIERVWKWEKPIIVAAMSRRVGEERVLPVVEIGPGEWRVASESQADVFYTVKTDENGDLACTCPAFQYRSGKCKHCGSVDAYDRMKRKVSSDSVRNQTGLPL